MDNFLALALWIMAGKEPEKVMDEIRKSGGEKVSATNEDSGNKK